MHLGLYIWGLGEVHRARKCLLRQLGSYWLILWNQILVQGNLYRFFFFFFCQEDMLLLALGNSEQATVLHVSRVWISNFGTTYGHL